MEVPLYEGAQLAVFECSTLIMLFVIKTPTNKGHSARPSLPRSVGNTQLDVKWSLHFTESIDCFLNFLAMKLPRSTTCVATVKSFLKKRKSFLKKEKHNAHPLELAKNLELSNLQS